MPLSSPGPGTFLWSASTDPKEVPVDLFLNNGISSVPVALVPNNDGIIRMKNPKIIQAELRSVTAQYQSITEVHPFGRGGILCFSPDQSCVLDLLKCSTFASQPCLDWKEPWYVIYRNYELDPLYGDSTHCANATAVTIDAEEPAFWTKEQGKTTKFVKDTLLSSPGYTTKNLVHVESTRPGKPPSKDPEVDFYMTAVFVSCNSCKVFRHHNIDGGAGCTLWKPESKITERDECCEFIYDLLCGASPKFHISKNCLQSS